MTSATCLAMAGATCLAMAGATCLAMAGATCFAFALRNNLHEKLPIVTSNLKL